MSNFVSCINLLQNNEKYVAAIFGKGNFPQQEVKFKEEVVIPDPEEKITLSLSTDKLCGNCESQGYGQRSNQYNYANLTSIFNSTKNCNYCGAVQSSLDFVLEFKNHLHEFITYTYKIELKILASISNKEEHLHLFKNTFERSSNKISFKRLPNIKNKQISEVKHICCFISRLGPVSNSGFEEFNSIKFDVQNFNDFSIMTDNKVFYVHKFMLASKSDVFKAMFSHDMKETQESTVKICDFSADVVEEFLHYIYTGKRRNSSISSIELYKLSDKYGIEGLKSVCFENIIFNLNCQNVMKIFKLANSHDLSDLKKKIFSFLNNHQEEMAQSESYREYLTENFTVESIADTLEFCYKYSVEDVKVKALDFVQNNTEISDNANFLNLFRSNPAIVQDLLLFFMKNWKKE